MMQNEHISAYYDDDEKLLKGLIDLKKEGVKILDVLTPFPVHGIDKVLGYRRSWISRVGFIGGAIGALLGFGFQAWVFTEAYPINIGGKPLLAIPSFIPVTFEMTVLCAAFAMVFAFLMRSKLGPGAPHVKIDDQITDDRFVVLIDRSGSESRDDIEALSKKLADSGAKGIKVNQD